MNVAEFESKRDDILQDIEELLQETEYEYNHETKMRQARIKGLNRAEEYKQYEVLANLGALNEALDTYNFVMKAFEEEMKYGY